MMKKKIKFILFCFCSFLLFPKNTLLFQSTGYLLFLLLFILYLLDYFDNWNDDDFFGNFNLLT